MVFNSSVASLVSMQSGVVYAMTKGAMNMLTKYLACEWAKVRDAGGERITPRRVSPRMAQAPPSSSRTRGGAEIRSIHSTRRAMQK